MLILEADVLFVRPAFANALLGALTHRSDVVTFFALMQRK
jgi:hypothetical protein